MPRRTVAPASPCSRALRTIHSYSGRPEWWSLSPMKMRRRQPSLGRTMTSPPDKMRGDPAQPDRSDGDHQVRGDVGRGERPASVAQQVDRLVPERREGGEAAENADDEESPRLGREEP